MVAGALDVFAASSPYSSARRSASRTLPVTAAVLWALAWVSPWVDSYKLSTMSVCPWVVATALLHPVVSHIVSGVIVWVVSISSNTLEQIVVALHMSGFSFGAESTFPWLLALAMWRLLPRVLRMYSCRWLRVRLPLLPLYLRHRPQPPTEPRPRCVSWLPLQLNALR